MAKVLIVVPAKNEEQLLKYSLKYLIYDVELLLNSTHEASVVVVDDGSTDATPLIAKSFARQYDYMHYIRLNHSKTYDSSIGVVRAVRAALVYAKTIGINWDILVQVDADTILIPPYLRKIVSALDKTRDAGIAGGVILDERRAPFHVPNTGMAVKRRAWELCGGYKAFFAPDTLLQLCVLQHGFKIIVCKTAKMLTLRETRVNPYRAGFIDGALKKPLPMAIYRSIRVQSYPKPNTLVKYLAGYLKAQLAKGIDKQLFDTRDKAVEIRKIYRHVLYYRLKRRIAL